MAQEIRSSLAGKFCFWVFHKVAIKLSARTINITAAGGCACKRLTDMAGKLVLVIGKSLSFVPYGVQDCLSVSEQRGGSSE